MLPLCLPVAAISVTHCSSDQVQGITLECVCWDWSSTNFILPCKLFPKSVQGGSKERGGGEHKTNLPFLVPDFSFLPYSVSFLSHCSSASWPGSSCFNPINRWTLVASIGQHYPQASGTPAPASDFTSLQSGLLHHSPSFSLEGIPPAGWAPVDWAWAAVLWEPPQNSPLAFSGH